MTAQSVILPLPSDHARFIVLRLNDLSIEELKEEVFPDMDGFVWFDALEAMLQDMWVRALQIDLEVGNCESSVSLVWWALHEFSSMYQENPIFRLDFERELLT